MEMFNSHNHKFLSASNRCYYATIDGRTTESIHLDLWLTTLIPIAVGAVTFLWWWEKKTKKIQPERQRRSDRCRSWQKFHQPNGREVRRTSNVRTTLSVSSTIRALCKGVMVVFNPPLSTAHSRAKEAETRSQQHLKGFRSADSIFLLFIIQNKQTSSIAN